MKFDDGTIFSDVSMISFKDSWTLTNATITNNILTVKPGGSAVLEISENSNNKDILTSTKRVSIRSKFTGDFNINSNYSSNSAFMMNILYSVNGVLSDTDVVQVGFNEVSSDSTGADITDDTLVELQGYKIVKLVFTVTNSGASDLVIKELGIYPAYKQYDIDVITEVAKFESIQADVAAINSVFTDDLLAERIETNFDAVNVNKPYTGEREYIEIYDNVVNFKYAKVLDGEGNYIPYVLNGKQMYWTDVKEGSDNYKKYLTSIDPVIRVKNNESLTEEEKQVIRDKFKAYIRGMTDVANKAKICYFDTPTESNVPVIVLGAGNGETSQFATSYIFKDGTSLQKNQTVFFKDSTGTYCKYITPEDEMVDVFTGGGGSGSCELLTDLIFKENSQGKLLGFHAVSESGAAADYSMLYTSTGELSGIRNDTLDKLLNISTEII